MSYPTPHTQGPLTDGRNTNWRAGLAKKNYRTNKKYIIRIFSTKFTENIANNLSILLNSYNISTEVLIKSPTIHDIQSCIAPNTYLFIFTPQHFLKTHLGLTILQFLPKNKFFLYQLEQINNQEKYNKHITDVLKELIKSSRCTFDYSQTNIKYYDSDLHVEYLPPPTFLHKEGSSNDKNILFYGGLNERRSNILSRLKEKYSNFKILSHTFDDDLINEINEATLVINLHYYEESVLETCRLNELISHHANIISEKPCEADMTITDEYLDLVTFVDVIKDDLSNIDGLFDAIESRLESTPKQSDIVEFIKRNNEYLKSTVLIKIYKNLFHKYFIGLKDPEALISYEIISNGPMIQRQQSKLFCHIHCYDLNKFNSIFTEYLKKICEFFSIVITYSIGEVGVITNSEEYILLKIPNKGMDIGGKFCMVDYITKKNLEFSHILFLHSKTDPVVRATYCDPLITNLNDIVGNIDKFDGIFPNLIWGMDDERLRVISGNHQYINKRLPEINHLYRDELLGYLKESKPCDHFSEGNMCILSRSVVQRIFSDKILYNILNYPKEFDYNFIRFWFKIDNIKDAYTCYQQNKERLARRHWYDGCIEHVFERIYMNFMDFNRCLVVDTKAPEIQLPPLRSKSIALYSHFSKDSAVDRYNYYNITALLTQVDYVFVLTNIKDKWDCSNSKIIIIDSNYGNEFSNYAVFIKRNYFQLLDINTLYLMADSILVANKSLFERRISELNHDFQGLVMNLNPIPHYQADFLKFHNKCIRHALNYFQIIGRQDHKNTISKYEIGLSQHIFSNNEYSINGDEYVYGNSNPIAYQPFLVLDTVGIIKREHILRSYPNIVPKLSEIDMGRLYKQYGGCEEYINKYVGLSV